MRGKVTDVHLIDGTYELFRHFYALPSALDNEGREVAGVRGVVASVQGLVREGATHVAIATDHIIESFRNRMWAGYKTGDGVEPVLFAQFPLLEEALAAAGFVVWPMIEFERTTRSQRAPQPPPAIHASIACTFARPTRISRSASAARASCNSIGVSA